MTEKNETSEHVCQLLFNYLKDIIYNPQKADLNIGELPKDFQNLGEGLKYFTRCVIETTELAKALSEGNLNDKLPSPENEIASSLKSLHATLRHLTWQVQQVANGDYQQKVDFMGDFAVAFNTMTQQLNIRHKSYKHKNDKLRQCIDLILANCPDLLLVFDTKGKIISTSKSYLDYVGILSRSEIIGKHLSEIMSPIVSHSNFLCLEKLFNNSLSHKIDSSENFDIDFKKDGNPRYYNMQITNMLDGNKKSKGVMVIFHDTTEINKANLEAARAREHAEKSANAKSEFLSRMSHEMLTPMNAIIGMTAIAKTSKENKRKDYCLQQIQNSSSQLLELINDILDISKIESEKFQLSKNIFNLKKAINKILKIAKAKTELKNQTLNVKLTPNIPEFVISDENKITKAITHIISNAIKFSPKNGNILIDIEAPFSNEKYCQVLFKVTDNGIGISKEALANLFDSFKQADIGYARKFDGAGLGLYIAKHIIELTEGNIDIKSEEGNGTCVTFHINLNYSDKKKLENLKQMEINNSTATKFLEGKRFLIADDVDINREIISVLLEDTGVSLDFAVDGEDAFGKFSSNFHYYDLILMDLHMPGTDGYSATKKIRNSGLPAASSVPIIAMTADLFSDSIHDCLIAGINDHLSKPVEPSELIAKIREYVINKG